ncbi:uncharacterized protein DSM5745_09295 [Aspergillus mulundensis]|uniref:Aminoglycoside phosphotransferase domain-containing protein n=1 Tax=Aspergillus mulundensis TaxID=1810919 RepID=A0A3D8R054_9EURO|nr:Uncharacterized protein DSM5745_09295 [Aspergillus mulundensis]RDW67429.1 Uncharacterized protein DSM5745_09295 [Aspergillus mulundensis]
MRPRMPFDDVAWERSESIEDAWVSYILKHDNLRKVGDFIVKHHKRTPTELCSPQGGAFNVSFRMKFQIGSSVMIRLTKPGSTMFPEEKTRYEVAAMRYVQDQTSIPVPLVLHFGSKDQGPPVQGSGAFMLMEYVEHALTMNEALITPSLKIEDRPILDPSIDEDKLERLYGEMADVLLQLSRVTLPQIGSLTQVDDFTWDSSSRPLTFAMNQLVSLGTLPRSKLPRRHFGSAQAYFESLADLHMDHLVHQRNDAVDSEDDCRRKYVARFLFRRLGREGQLTSPETDHGPFPLWCDDFRPANVLLNDKLQSVGVVDWEFSYAAPVEFTRAPPWWLLLEQPEYWPEGLDAWSDTYELRLETFLRALEKCEDTAIERGRLSEDQRLSGHMRRSWETGEFWVVYAARKPFAFDAIFWKKLDTRFFGPCTLSNEDRWKERLELLDEKGKEDMEALVKRKMEEAKERLLAWEPDEATREFARVCDGDQANSPPA